MKRLRDGLVTANAQQDQIPLRLSFGAATADKGASLREALKQADEGMYHEKRNQKGVPEDVSLGSAKRAPDGRHDRRAGR